MLFDARGIASFWTPRRPRTCGEACERRGGAVRRSPTRRAAAVVRHRVRSMTGIEVTAVP